MKNCPSVYLRYNYRGVKKFNPRGGLDKRFPLSNKVKAGIKFYMISSAFCANGQGSVFLYKIDHINHASTFVELTYAVDFCPTSVLAHS